MTRKKNKLVKKITDLIPASGSNYTAKIDMMNGWLHMEHRCIIKKDEIKVDKKYSIILGDRKTRCLKLINRLKIKKIEGKNS